MHGGVAHPDVACGCLPRLRHRLLRQRQHPGRILRPEVDRLHSTLCARSGEEPVERVMPHRARQGMRHTILRLVLLRQPQLP